ncbi:hypothetical protein GobsT_59990 [Gemmata obscuriglobus]|nr:hypothetical protein GobsT_59990 [Gemmata obscuriglobus]VTS10516.1 unnamed protein product [Gemmata obscuriglobus UQM 2246]
MVVPDVPGVAAAPDAPPVRAPEPRSWPERGAAGRGGADRGSKEGDDVT